MSRAVGFDRLREQFAMILVQCGDVAQAERLFGSSERLSPVFHRAMMKGNCRLVP